MFVHFASLVFVGHTALFSGSAHPKGVGECCLLSCVRRCLQVWWLTSFQTHARRRSLTSCLFMAATLSLMKMIILVIAVCNLLLELTVNDTTLFYVVLAAR